MHLGHCRRGLRDRHRGGPRLCALRATPPTAARRRSTPAPSAGEPGLDLPVTTTDLREFEQLPSVLRPGLVVARLVPPPGDADVRWPAVG